jgi:hypothetical protein
MVTSPRKPTAGFWITVALVAVLAYPLSMGPACWISSYTNFGVPVVNVAYLPMMRLYDVSPEFIQDGILWYSRIGSARGWCWSGANEWKDFSDQVYQ